MGHWLQRAESASARTVGLFGLWPQRTVGIENRLGQPMVRLLA
jgi:hypothetical protein